MPFSSILSGTPESGVVAYDYGNKRFASTLTQDQNELQQNKEADLASRICLVGLLHNGMIEFIDISFVVVTKSGTLAEM